MRVWHIASAALVVFGLGCNKSPEGGSAGTKDSFSLSLPAGPSKDIKQGDKETSDGSVTRGADFKKDVALKVEAPAKIDVKLNKDSIKASEGDTKFSITISPAADAPVGEHEVKVTGTPAGGGNATTGSFKIKVIAK